MVEIKKIPPLVCPKCGSQRVYDCTPSYSRKRTVRCDDCRAETQTGVIPKSKYAPRDPLEHAAKPRPGQRRERRSKEKKGFADQQLAVDRFVEDT